MPFKTKKRGKLTYYYEGEDAVLSAMVVEEQADGDLRIYFSGLTGGYSATSVLKLDTVTTMDPAAEIPLVFQCWEHWLREAGICQSIAEIDFIELHAFGAQPKSPSPLADPSGYREEQKRLRAEYAEAYRNFFKEKCPEIGSLQGSPFMSLIFQTRPPPMNFTPWVYYKKTGESDPIR